MCVGPRMLYNKIFLIKLEEILIKFVRRKWITKRKSGLSRYYAEGVTCITGNTEPISFELKPDLSVRGLIDIYSSDGRKL